MNEREDDGGRGVTDGRVGDVRTSAGTVGPQMGGRTTCERKRTAGCGAADGGVDAGHGWSHGRGGQADGRCGARTAT